MANHWCPWSHDRKVPLKCFSWWRGKFQVVMMKHVMLAVAICDRSELLVGIVTRAQLLLPDADNDILLSFPCSNSINRTRVWDKWSLLWFRVCPHSCCSLQSYPVTLPALQYIVYRVVHVTCYSSVPCIICCQILNLLAPELFFFLILAHSVYKMWIIQGPNKLELWNKLHFKEEKTESIHHV